MEMASRNNTTNTTTYSAVIPSSKDIDWSGAHLPKGILHSVWSRGSADDVDDTSPSLLHHHQPRPAGAGHDLDSAAINHRQTRRLRSQSLQPQHYHRVPGPSNAKHPNVTTNQREEKKAADVHKKQSANPELKLKDLTLGEPEERARAASTASAMSSYEAREVMLQMRLEDRLRKSAASSDPWDRRQHQMVTRGRRKTEIFNKNTLGLSNSGDKAHKTLPDPPRYISNRSEVLRRRRSTSFCLSQLQQDDFHSNSNHHQLEGLSEGKRKLSWNQPTTDNNHDNHSLMYGLHSESLQPVEERFHHHQRKLLSNTVSSVSDKYPTFPQAGHLNAKSDGSHLKNHHHDPRTPYFPNLYDTRLTANSSSTHWTHNLTNKRNSFLRRSSSWDRDERDIQPALNRKRRSISDGGGGVDARGSDDKDTSPAARHLQVFKMKREHSFEITYPGYDSRFKKFSTSCIAVGGDMDTAVQRLQATSDNDKCKKWLHGVPTQSPKIWNKSY